jgi:hypothetical protein
MKKQILDSYFFSEVVDIIEESELQDLNQNDLSILSTLLFEEQALGKKILFPFDWASAKPLSLKFQEKLVNDEDRGVRDAIAQNPNLDSKFHEKLVNDKDWDVRRAIAKNPNLDSKFHEKLVNDEDRGVRRAMENNPNYRGKK